MGSWEFSENPAEIKRVSAIPVLFLLIGIGVVLLASVILHLVPRSTFLDALPITACLGGAVASKLRVEAPHFDIAFGLIIAMLLWGGFWLREPQVRAILPLVGT